MKIKTFFKKIYLNYLIYNILKENFKNLPISKTYNFKTFDLETYPTMFDACFSTNIVHVIKRDINKLKISLGKFA
jgi:hypothetical protein